MKNKFHHIVIGCCAVILCAASCYAQYDTCTQLSYWMARDPLYTDTIAQRQKYDSIKAFVQLCANRNPDSYLAFGHLDDAVQLMSWDNNNARYDQYRSWLISVLYLAPNFPVYYCNCMGSITRTFQYGKYRGTGLLAVERYLYKFDKHGCVYNQRGADSLYSVDSAYWAQEGYNTADSALPPLDSLGLGFLLHQNGVSPTTGASHIYLSSFSVVPNPSQGMLTADYTLAYQSLVQFSVYDELGRTIWSRARTSEPEGVHTLPIDLRSSPSGTYYVRIEAGNGEVQTVKCVIEK